MKHFFKSSIFIGALYFTTYGAHYFNEDIWAEIILSSSNLKNMYRDARVFEEKTTLFFRFLYPCIFKNSASIMCINKDSSNSGSKIKTGIENYLQMQYIHSDTFFDCAPHVIPQFFKDISAQHCVIGLKTVEKSSLTIGSHNLKFYLLKYARDRIYLLMHFTVYYSSDDQDDSCIKTIFSLTDSLYTRKGSIKKIKDIFSDEKVFCYDTFIAYFKPALSKCKLDHTLKDSSESIITTVEIMKLDAIDYTFAKTYFAQLKGK